MSSIEVEGPDGSIHEFPQGTDPTVIKSAMAKRFSPKPSAPMASQGMQKLVEVNPSAAPQDADHPAWAAVKDQLGQGVQALDDVARLMANGVTLGYGDKIAAKMDELTGINRSPKKLSDLVTGANQGDVYERNLAAQRAMSDEAMKRAGVAGHVADIMGTLVPAGAVSRGVSGAAKVGTYANSLLTGAGLGLGSAGGHDTDLATGAGIGAVAGLGGQALGNALSAGVGKVAGSFNKKPVVPTADELRQSAQNAYIASENAGVIANPGATKRLADALRGDMADFGYSPYMQPKGQAVLAELARMDGQNATLKGVDTLRKVTSRMREGEPSEAELGRRLVGGIDNFTNNLKPADILAGDAPAGVSALNDARGLWQRVAKNDELESALLKAQNRASSTGSGGNIDNATRQNVRKLMESRSWTPDETNAMTKVIQGTPVQNAMRLAGKLSPEGNGLSLMLHLGAAGASGGSSLIGAALGSAAKRGADAMTKNNVNQLAELIRSGGDAAALAGPKNAIQKLAETKRESLARALMSGGVIASPSFAQVPVQE